MKVLLAATVLLQLVLHFGPAQSLDPKVNSPCYHSLCAKEIKSQLNLSICSYPFKCTTSPFVQTLSGLFSNRWSPTTMPWKIMWIFSTFPSESLLQWVLCIYCEKESLSVWAPLQTENKDKTVSFECQHGPAECDGNRIQSCVLNHLGNNNPDAHTDFVVCQMKFSAEPTGAKVSEIIVWLPWESRIWKVLWLNISPQTHTHTVRWSRGCPPRRDYRVLRWADWNSTAIGSRTVDQGHFPLVCSYNCLQLGEWEIRNFINIITSSCDTISFIHTRWICISEIQSKAPGQVAEELCRCCLRANRKCSSSVPAIGNIPVPPDDGLDTLII